MGGGPAGLYLAYLLKRRKPELSVSVFERAPENVTWGFGVVLPDGGLRQLREADEESYARINAVLHPLYKQTFIVDDERVPIDKARPGGAIGRLTLLHVLHGLCRGVGVDLHFEANIPGLSDLAAFDLVVGADGANSLVRDSLARELGTKKRLLGNRFAWFGVARSFDGSFLNFKSIPNGGLCGHYYSYEERHSTFVMECDETTWFALGLAEANDDTRRLVTQSYFADELGGDPLLDNNSIWRQFPVITSERWYHDRFVLLGDALRTAHFSIGSGTRMALEDAIALADALVAEPNRDRALERYVASRIGPMNKLVGAAEGSFTWYEGFSSKLRLKTATEFALSFLRRTGRISPERLQRDFPEFIAHARRQGVDITIRQDAGAAS
ncbi:MAG: FAD-dependent monooxygenase [Alphaproteobacteria bacterium]|nr:FAD-dependent monooxygenase [Alphaproteobacteria bacterium]